MPFCDDCRHSAFDFVRSELVCLRNHPITFVAPPNDNPTPARRQARRWGWVRMNCPDFRTPFGDRPISTGPLPEPEEPEHRGAWWTHPALQSNPLRDRHTEPNPDDIGNTWQRPRRDRTRTRG
jgi:hypothetical protein